jgi:ElaB/YqjD/DUF883 family membrane-anchored ribosome-binding protein
MMANTTQQPQSGTQGAAYGTMGAHQGQAEGLSSTMTHKASDAWQTTKEGVQAATSSVASAAENTWDELTHFIGRYPWACLAASCGVGYLVGCALGREDSLSGGWSRSLRGSMGYRSSPSWRGEEYAQPRNQGWTSNLTERASDAWNSAQQGAQQMASAVASGTNEALDRVSHWSREYPLATPTTGLLIGACCGFLTGWALGCQTSR